MLRFVRFPLTAHFLATLVVAIVATAGVLAAFDSGEECDSLGIDPIWLSCQNACQEGCAGVTVNTNDGHEGVMCSCDIIGPPAVCCKIAFVEEFDDFELVGECALSECNEGACTKIPLLQFPSMERIGWAARCL